MTKKELADLKVYREQLKAGLRMMDLAKAKLAGRLAKKHLAPLLDRALTEYLVECRKEIGTKGSDGIADFACRVLGEKATRAWLTKNL